MKVKKILFLSILFLRIAAPVFSQKLKFEHLSNNDGLVSSKVTSIVKDHQGFMWFGTFNGLSRYDGYTFTNFVNDPTDTTTITDNYVRCLYETKEGLLIIGFQYNGICIFNKETETFTRYRHIDDDPKSIVHNYVLTIFQDSRGAIWIGTRGGLDQLDIKTGTFTHYKPFPTKNNIVSSVCEDDQGNLWLYGRDEQLCRFNLSTHSFYYVNFAAKIELSKTFYRGGILKFDTQGFLWIGNEAEGLFRYDIHTNTCIPYTMQNGKLKSNTVFTITEDSEGKIWIGTDGGGLYKYDYGSDSLEIHEHDPYDNFSLNSNAVYSVYESDPGIIWIGLYAAGIDICKKNKQKFQMLSTVGAKGKTLKTKSVLAIESAGPNKFWIGTDGGGLNLYDLNSGAVQYFTKENFNLNSNVVKSMICDSEQNLWLGSYGAGLEALNLRTLQDTTFHVGAHTQSLLNDHVWSLCETSDNKIWIGLLGYGIQVYDKIKKSFTYFPFDSAAVKEAICDIFVIREDSKGRVWIGSEEAGLGYYNRQTNKFVKFPYKSGKPGTINDNDISDIFEDSQHNIWIGTMWGGLNKLIDIENKKFISYTEKDGLPSNNIRSILEDDHGNLWLSTDNGICMFKVKEKKFVNFEMEDGLINKEFNYNSKYKTQDGMMAFGGIEGLNIFHPDSIHFNGKPPIVVFTDFKIFNQSVHANKKYDGREYLSKSIGCTKEVVLTHEDYVFSIEFAALDFISPYKNKYAYKLEGFDNNWTYVNSNKRFATYTNLDPGNYTFRVMACNNDGVWNKAGTQMSIVVLPPYWKTWWFRAIIASLLVLLVAGLFYFRIKGVKQRNRTLTEEVKKRTQQLRQANDGLQERNHEIMVQQKVILQKKDEIEAKKYELEHANKMKDKFFSIIGHDLKGPVKALSYLTGTLKNDWEQLDKKMQHDFISHIDVSTKKIQNLIFSLLEWARTQSGQVKPEPAVISIEKILTENIDLLYQQAAQKHVVIKVNTNPNHMVFADYNMITTVVRNILSNSIKYSYRDSIINVSSDCSINGGVKIIIEDNGIGMTHKVLTKLFSLDKGPSLKGTDNETGTGLGMLISQEFVQLNNGTMYAESKEGQGSTFFVELPAA